MAKKKKQRKVPPLSLLDKTIYVVSILFVIAIILVVFWLYTSFPRYFGLHDSFVMAVEVRATSLWLFPFWSYISLSLLAIVTVPYRMKQPIFGNPKITYGLPHWESVYPLLGKQYKKKKTSQKGKSVTKKLFLGWFVIFFILFLVSLFSLLGRNALMQNGDITIYGISNREKRTYTMMDISKLEIQTDFYTAGRSHGKIWTTEYEFIMTDGRTYTFSASCFRSDKDAFESMIKMKTLVDSRKIVIKGKENLDKLIEDQQYTPEELALLYELFEMTDE